MLILISKEELVSLLIKEQKCWEVIGGSGPNINAFEFDPQTTDPQTLRDLGYYDNRDSWTAGVRIKAIQDYLDILEQQPQYKPKR
jgi:hypothetical protein